MRLKVSNVCQLYAKNIWQEYTDLYGVSIKNNNDGSITLNGTATQTFYYTNRLDYEIKPNHKYLYVDYYPQTPSWDTYIGGCEGKVNHESAVMFAIYNVHNGGTIDLSSPTLPSNTLLNTFCMCYKGFTLNNVTIKPQLFDLTEMYGAGNEPTTVEQFRQDFPNEMYDYSPVCWKKFRRLKYVTETKNLLDYNKFNPIWKTNGIISDSGYLSKPASTFNTSLFYTVVGYSAALPDVSNLLQLKGTYTFSISSISIGDIYIMKYNADGTMNKQVGSLMNIKKVETLTFDELTYVDIKIQKETAVIVTGLMVQEGSTATPYQPYGYLPLNRGKYIANKEPVQLLDKTKFSATTTTNGVTFTNNGDGTVTVNGTNNSEIYYNLEVLTSIPIEHKVIIDDRNSTLYFFGDMRTKDNVLIGVVPPRTIFTLPSNLARLNMLYYVRYNTVGITYNNELSRPQLFDLTAMYGAGNEPTTVEQFRSDFPNELYDYNPYNAITFR